MIFKYRKEIFDAIVDTIIETERGLSYSQIYEQVNDKLDSHLSHRDYWDHLLNMKKDGFLMKLQIGVNTIYTLTNAAKNGRKLGILGVDKNNNRERLPCLYQFLILCDCFYRGMPISERELDKILDYVSATRKNLTIESRVQANGTNCCETVYKPISTIRVRMIELEGNDNIKNSYYYYKEEGFSIKEVMDLLNSGVRDYPLFVGNFQYNETDIIEGTEMLINIGVIGLTRSYDNQEPRCSIRETSLQKMKDLIWDIHALESSYLFLEGRSRKLTDYEKLGLKLLFGIIGSYKIIKDAYSSRKSGQKLVPVGGLKKLREAINIIIDLKIKDFYDKYHHVVRENYLYSDMIEKVVIRNSVLKNRTRTS